MGCLPANKNNKDEIRKMKQPDNWGWKARIGMFIVSVEAVPEAEWWAMLPPGVSLHIARVTASTPWAKWSSNGNEVQFQDDLARGATQFAAMHLSAVLIGHTSSSIIGGKGWDTAVVKRLSKLGPDGRVATTNGLDCQAALRICDVKRPFLIFPAWFNDRTIEEGWHYFSDHGFAPAGQIRFDPGQNWQGVAPSKLYAKGMGFDQDVDSLYRQICAECPPEADGILIAGTGFRCISILDALEKELKRPVISANQASLWHCLRLSGLQDRVDGYGSLLSKR